MSIEPALDGATTQEWIKDNHPKDGLFQVYYTKDFGVSFEDEGYGKRYEWYYKDGHRADGKSYGWWPNIPKEDPRYGSTPIGWDGSLKLIFSWKNGLLDGECIEYYDNKTIFWKGRYKDGNRNGNFKEYFHNGNLNSTGNYKNGMPINRWETYFKNGKLKSQSIFDKNGRQKVITKNNELGKEMVRDGNGSFSEHYKNGNVKYNGNFINGERAGRWAYYNEDGSPIGYAIYKDGKVWNGVLISYYEGSGRINRKAEFKEGRLHSSVKYFETGKIEIEEKFEDGKRYLLNQFDYNGKILVKNGNGKSDIVGMDGGIIRTVEYKGGELVQDV
tara:strand:- start:14 stop:1003 length:990 start_codon:yes stop_codon:yes gene_type:complete